MKKVVLSLGIGVMGASSLGIAPSAFAAVTYTYHYKDVNGVNQTAKNQADFKKGIDQTKAAYRKKIDTLKQDITKIEGQLPQLQINLEKVTEEHDKVAKELAQMKKDYAPQDKQKKKEDQLNKLYKEMVNLAADIRVKKATPADHSKKIDIYEKAIKNLDQEYERQVKESITK